MYTRASIIPCKIVACILLAGPAFATPPIQIYPGANVKCSLLYVFDGAQAEDLFGSSIDSRGDVNGDGYPELLVGAFSGGIAHGGFVTVYSGFDMLELATFHGKELGDRFGNSVCWLGDLNLDGLSEFAIGVPSSDDSLQDGGKVLVISGNLRDTLLELFGDDEGSSFGFAVDNASDLDGDEIDDLLISAPYSDEGQTNTGSVYAFSGATGDRLFKIVGSEFKEQLGEVIAGLGDLDGDDYPDFALSARGAIILNSQGDTLAVYDADVLKGNVNSIGRIGDIDYDGTDDFAVGTQYIVDTLGSTKGIGLVSLFSGSTWNKLNQISGKILPLTSSTLFGFAVAHLGDIDSDGFPDFAVGAPLDGVDSLITGLVYVYSGKHLDTVCVLSGEGDGDWFGYSISSTLGQFGCGISRLVVGALFNDSAGNNAGRVYVFGFAPLSTDVHDDDQILPRDFSLSQNYPNPFNPSTEIAFALSRKSDVTVTIHNVLGQIVRTLSQGTLSAGEYRVTWDGCNTDGAECASGVYFYTLKSREFTQTKKMTLVR